MTGSRAVVIGLLLLVGLAIAPAGTVALADGTFGLEEDDETEANAMGPAVSTFMQSSAADTSEGVDNGMFDAAYENAAEEDRKAIVADRTHHLEGEYERLEGEYERLEDRKEEMNPVAYDAQLIRIAVSLSALETSVHETIPRADDEGVDTDRLNEIRESTHAATESGIAPAAAEIVGIDLPGGDNPPGQEESGDDGPENSGSDW